MLKYAYIDERQKYMKIKNILAVILASALTTATLASCNKTDNTDTPGAETESVVNNSEGVTDSKENTEADNTEDNPEENVAVPEKSTVFKNALTGLETTEYLSTQRPLAIMFNNIYAALPQVGISKVDVLYEITVEGAITRLMGVVTDWATLPTIGSVRSSRDYFIDISDAHNAIYVHAGGSDYAYSVLWERGTDRIDGTNGGYASGAAFYRDPERMKTMATEHTLVTNGEKLAVAIGKNNFQTTYKDGFAAPFTFADESFVPDGTDANYVYIPFSFYAQSYLDYDASKNVYMKGQYLGTRSSLDKHSSPHIDGSTGSQLEFTNILIMSAYHSGALDDKGRISVNFTGTGEGCYITRGKAKPIVWKKESRTSGYKLYEKDGTTELVMNPGKTYAAIVPTGTEVVIK